MTPGYLNTESRHSTSSRRGSGVVRVGDEQARISRRKFLVRAKRLVYLALGTWGAGKLGAFDGKGGGVQSKADAMALAESMPGGEQSLPKNEAEAYFQKDLVLGAIGKDGGGKIRQQVNSFKQRYKTEGVQAQVNRTSQYDLLVKDKFGRAELPPVAADLVMGQIIVESGGDKRAVSEAGARGIVQIMPEMAQAHNMKVTGDFGDERHNEASSVNVLAEELKKSWERWGNWSLALWEWHVGADQIYKAIETYVNDVYGERLPNIYVPKSFPNADFEAQRRVGLYRRKISDWGINVCELFGDKRVKAMFVGEGWDKTDEYVLRIVAAAELYRERAI